MRTLKELMNDAANSDTGIKRINSEDADALKRCVLDIYRHVAEICEKNGLTIMLAGGSCLGAVRHHGYIPWDDDLDVMMPRPDYDRLIELCQNGALEERFEFRHPMGKEDSLSMFLKIYNRQSKILGIDGDNCVYPQGCYLDVFPIDGCSRRYIVRYIKGFIANSIRLAANLVLDAKPWTETQRKFYASDTKLYRMMHIRKIVGNLMSIISHHRWVRLYDGFVRNYNMTGMVCIPTGRKLYNGEVFSSDVLFPPVKAVFENLQVNIPADYDKYLTNLYHNYLDLPPIEARESHFVISINIPEEFYKH